MKLKELEIKGPNTYETWEGLRGSITLSDADGEQKITLTAAGIRRILGCISEEVQIRAKANASRVGVAMDEAVEQTLLIEGAGNLKLD